jgi:phage tail protein X
MRAVGEFSYTTRAGDMFDALALDAYGDESLAHVIIQANPDCAATLIFDAGVNLTIPIVDMARTPETLPPWRRTN